MAEVRFESYHDAFRLKYQYFGSFFCAMVAAMTLRFLDPFGSGKLVLFQVTYDKVNSAYTLPNMTSAQMFILL